MSRGKSIAEQRRDQEAAMAEANRHGFMSVMALSGEHLDHCLWIDNGEPGWGWHLIVGIHHDGIDTMVQTRARRSKEVVERTYGRDARVDVTAHATESVETW